MFTGLVEGRGSVAAIQPQHGSARLMIRPPAELHEGTEIGDSISINGCCLTVIESECGSDRGPLWSFEAGPETLTRTNLGRLHIDHPVNLERSLPVNARLGGHLVQGHVDGTAEVADIDREGEWITMRFAASSELTAQMVSKGSVAIDGVSLTLVDVEPQSFSVALIPHTLEVTTLGLCKVGDPVNIETDILGKYIQKMLAPYLPAADRENE